MRALVLRDFGAIVVEEVPAPEPAADEVVIEIVATGICGSDVHGFTGENGRRVPGQIMGHESVGRIAARGADAAEFSIGQLVTFNPVVIPADHGEAYAGREQHDPDRWVIGVRTDRPAAFAELLAVPERNIVALDESMPVERGALIEPLAVAVHAVRRAGVRAGDRVLVVGGGPIGQSTVLALLMAGASRIVVSELEPARRRLVESLGAIAVDPAEGAAIERIHRALGGPADAALDAVGISETLDLALEATRLGGTVCLVGMGAPRIDLSACRGSTEARVNVGSYTYPRADFPAAAAWIARAPDTVDALISREISIDEAPGAFAALAAGDGTPGKILVRFDRARVPA
jgi:2-desacetyl-2-hydroxyethyl bacteriochlorophyllide A dehydrogenase